MSVGGRNNMQAGLRRVTDNSMGFASSNSKGNDLGRSQIDYTMCIWS